MATLIRKCTYKEFRQNERCKFCDYFEKTETVISGIMFHNGLCHRWEWEDGIPRPRKSSGVCLCFVKRGFKTTYQKLMEEPPQCLIDF